MPNSNTVKSLGLKWDAIRERCRTVALPPVGMPLTSFVEHYLRDVPGSESQDVIKALRRKGDILVYLVEGEWRVFREKPKEIRRTAKPAAPALRNAISSIAGEALAYLVVGDQRAVARIGTIMDRHARQGADIPALRRAIQTVFDPALWNAIVREGVGQMPPSRPGTDIEGDGPEPRVLRYLARQGRRGAGKTRLLQGIRPYMSATDMASTLVALEDQCLIVSCECRPEGKGYKREVYFLAEYGLPTLQNNGAFYMANQ